MRTISVILLALASEAFCQPPQNGSKTGPISSPNFSGAAITTAVPPSSLFDAVRGRFNPVSENIEVKDGESRLDTAGPRPIEIGGEEIISAAGSYGDFMRYLRVLPGVVATSDTNNEVLVRGGHPIENLYLVDGFETPNINHLSRLGSTGGFASMIDSALVQGLTVHTGGYGTEFPDRLSSVTEIRLLDAADPRSHAEADLGIQGIGGLVQSKIQQMNLLTSVHHGLLDAVTSDAGLSGVPSYSNELSRLEIARPAGERLTLLNVAGWDSIAVTPCQSDWEETSEINSQYASWRTTTGLRWQKPFSSKSFGTFSATDSELVQRIHQQDQFLDPSKARITKPVCPLPKNYVTSTPVYTEDTSNGSTSTSASYIWADSRLSISTGTTAWLQRPKFNIAQPVGVYSPYSAAPRRSDATAIATDFSTEETGTFVDLAYRGFRNLSLRGGFRVQTFAFGSHVTSTARVSARYHLGESLSVNGSFSSYAQLPPYIYLASFPENHRLAPMRVQHRVIGFDFYGLPGSEIHIEAYDKPYSQIPAATEYPAVTFHSMPDQLGDEIIWLPMNSSGAGRASGIEFSDTTHFGSRAVIRGSMAYARAKLAGTDGVMRPSNFDLPWIANLLSTTKVGKGFGASARFGFATGRPYTPYNLVASIAQNRPIYDLARVNALRAPCYSRLDVQMSKDIRLHGQHLQLYAGVDNLLNHENFLTFAWLPLAHYHRGEDQNPVRQVNQMPIFPNFGIRFIVR